MTVTVQYPTVVVSLPVVLSRHVSGYGPGSLEVKDVLTELDHRNIPVKVAVPPSTSAVQDVDDRTPTVPGVQETDVVVAGMSARTRAMPGSAAIRKSTATANAT